MKEEIKFEIDQLRKDKIIYAVEACATTLICYFSYMVIPELIGDTQLSEMMQTLAFFLAVGYTLYMGIGNFYRLARVKKLEKKLKKV